MEDKNKKGQGKTKDFFEIANPNSNIGLPRCQTYATLNSFTYMFIHGFTQNNAPYVGFLE